MLALLALVPAKDWFWTAAVVALVAGWLSYGVHQRHIQAAKDKEADARVAAAAQVHNQEVENAAAGKVAEALAAYKASELQPVVVPNSLGHLVCHTSSRGAVPNPAGPASGGNGASPVPAASDAGFNPAPAVIADGRDADAQVTLLQALIRSYQAAGVVAK